MNEKQEWKREWQRCDAEWERWRRTHKGPGTTNGEERVAYARIWGAYTRAYLPRYYHVLSPG